MKVSVLITHGAKQVMLTPESPHEKEALSYIAPGDVLKAVVRTGTFVHDRDKHMGIQVSECRGGYYREYPDSESLMFVIKEAPKMCPNCGAGFYKDTFNCPRCANRYSWNGLELMFTGAVAKPVPEEEPEERNDKPSEVLSKETQGQS